MFSQFAGMADSNPFRRCIAWVNNNPSSVDDIGGIHGLLADINSAGLNITGLSEAHAVTIGHVTAATGGDSVGHRYATLTFIALRAP